MSRAPFAAVAVAAALLSVGCRTEPAPAPAAAAAAVAAPRDGFRDEAAARGVDFRHANGGSGSRYLVEITGSGGGFFDYDGDGDQDLYLLNGAVLAAPGQSAPEVLYRNVLLRNDGDGRYHDATDAAAVGDAGYGYGLAAGDVDNDGDQDLYVTNFGGNVLYRNRGDGSFADVTAATAAGDDRWSTAAVLFDYDRDGDLDLYVTNYVDFDLAAFEPCVHSTAKLEIYCTPSKYPGLPDRLLRNELVPTGELRFTDVTSASGIAAAGAGNGLGAVAGDVDGDGDLDLYVANDRDPNWLFVNRHGEPGAVASFTEEATLLGCAYGEGAKAEAGMGVDLGDFDADGDLDVVVTNLESETNAVYRNEQGLAMLEASYGVGIGAASLPLVGFGVRLADFDLDGDLDLAVANGHIWDNIAAIRQGASFAQPDQLFGNRGGRFDDRGRLDPDAGDRVGRALATADVDDDGDLDILVTNNAAAPFLLINRATAGRPAVGLRLTGRSPSNRDAIGARVTWTAGGAARLAEVRTASSYLASNDPRLLLAADDADAALAVAIRWPSGRQEEHRLLPGSYHHVVEGEGVAGSIRFRDSR